jgi:hypothetical protein
MLLPLSFCNSYAFHTLCITSGEFITQSIQQSDITITISSDKKEYVVLEPVWINIRFKNIGDDIDSMEINEDLDLVENLIIKDSKGQILPYTNAVREYAYPTYVKIRPNEELNYDLEISESFGVFLRNTMFRSYLAEGNYSVQCSYKSSRVKSYSNIIMFNVITPIDTQLIEFKELFEIYNSENLTISDVHNTAFSMKSFVEKYPASIYTDRVVNYLSYSALYNDSLADSSYNKDCMDFLENHPNSFYSKTILRNTLITNSKHYGKSRKELETFLIKLIDKYPGAILMKAAQKLLDEDYIESIVK